MEPQRAPEPSVLHTYLAVVRRRLGIIVLVAAVATAAAVALSLLAAPTYRSTAQVLLQPRLSEQILQSESARARSAGDSATELEVMRSGGVEAAVAAELGYDPDVSLAQVGETQVVDITALADTADGAARDANTYAAVYAETRREQTIADLEDASVELQGRIGDIDAQIASLPAPTAEQGDDPQREALEDRRNTYADQLDALQVATNLTVTGGAQVVSEASVPESPISPRPWRDGAIALAVGLAVGIGLAFLFEHLNDRVRSKVELEGASDGLPVLALVPSVPAWRKRRTRDVIGPDTESASEAFRSLRTAVQFMGIERGTHVVQVTSPLSGEGKTTTVANLGLTFAHAGKRVVLVDCDLRRPRLHRVFGVDREPGLVSVLLGEATIEEAIVPVDAAEDVALLPAGQSLPNPADLLVLDGFSSLVDSLRGMCDHAVIDTPPVLPVTDALIVSAVADQTLVVAMANVSRQRDVRRAQELLRQIDAPVTGTVLNMVPTRGRYGYRYFPGYDYFSAPDVEPRGGGVRGRLRRTKGSAGAEDEPAGSHRTGI